jgi:ATP-dependent Clp endopeptidase proteolytic subunit ClpP
MFGHNMNKRRRVDISYEYDFTKLKKDKKSSSLSDDNKDDSSEQIELSLSKKQNDKKIERDNNHIYFYSEVDRESIYDLCTMIREAEEECILTSLKLNIDDIPIYLHISSYGGSVYAAFNAIDIIQSCKVPIYTIIEGATASAGTLISIIGKKRFIRPNAYMLIHQLSSGCWGKMSEIEDEFQNLKQLMDKIKNIYKDNTNIPKKELNELLKHDLWLNCDKCIKYGLVDELWK